MNMARVLPLVCVIILSLFKPTVSTTSTYYMNERTNCYSYSVNKHMYSKGDSFNVKAWTLNSYRTALSGGCTSTFGAFSSYGFKYRFDKTAFNNINDCSVKLRIYSGIFDNDEALLETYTCHDDSYMSTTYSYSSDNYITVKLENPSSSTQFDFTLILQSYDTDSSFSNTTILSVGGIVVIVIGVVIFVVIVASLSIFFRSRRAPMSRGRPVISTTVTSGYSYPTGPAAYPPTQTGYSNTSSYSGSYPAPGTVYNQPPPSYDQLPLSYRGGPAPAPYPQP